MQLPNDSIKILKCKVCGVDVKCNANYPINEITCQACYASTNPSVDSWQRDYSTTQTRSRCAILTESRGETPPSPLHQWTIDKVSTFPPKARQSCYAYSIDSQPLPRHTIWQTLNLTEWQSVNLRRTRLLWMTTLASCQQESVSFLLLA